MTNTKKQLYSRATKAFSLANRAYFELLAVLDQDSELDDIRADISRAVNRLHGSRVVREGNMEVRHDPTSDH